MTGGKGKGKGKVATRKRARRPYESAVDTRKGVGLPIKKDFDIWRQGRRAKPFFDIFEKCFLETSQFRKGAGAPDESRPQGVDGSQELCVCGRRTYEQMYADTSTKLFGKKKAQARTAVTWNTTTYRKLCLITTWLGLFYNLDYKVSKLKKFCANRGTSRTILEDLRKGQARQGVPEADRIVIPDETDIEKILGLHCTGAPKLRPLFSILAELVVLLKEKVTIWVNNPTQMQWLHSAEQLRADLRPLERDELLRQFNEDPDQCQVLICSYAVSVAGLNMHKMYRTVIEYEPAPCEGVRQQMVGRVRRKGQKRWCRHITLIIKDSFNSQQNAISLLRSLPMLMTQLNLEVFGAGEDGEHALGDYVISENDLYPVDDAKVAGKDLKVISPDHLLMYIQLKMAGERLEGDMGDLFRKAKAVKKEIKPVSAPLWK
ncbi:hypothetical protein EJ07DRAFT_159119 [Lizonia empirigonia]|nr:hypothetical protein EJ07DRAFT_159119 [Lizonia empirigonia]